MTRKKKNQSKKKLDSSVIEQHMTNMAMAALTGQSIPTRSVTLTVDLPEPMIAIAEHVAAEADVPTEEMIARMVKEGLSYRMQYMAKEALANENEVPQETIEATNELKGMTEAIKNLQSNMGDVSGLMDTLNKLSESLNGINSPGDMLKIR